MALAISPLDTTPHTLTLASTAYTSDFEVTGMARRYDSSKNLSDDIIHLAVTEHIKEAGKLLIGWVSEDYHRLDELDDLQKMVIQVLLNPMGLRTLEARLTTLEREEHKEARQHIRTPPSAACSAHNLDV